MAGRNRRPEFAAAEEKALLAEQQEYYRRRAPAYDSWWQRTGAYDYGPEHTHEWVRQVGEVEAALDRFGADGTVLELAGGTGWWTQRLARTAGQLTVVDSSPEAIAISRARVGDRRVQYVVADVFDWLRAADRRYDVVFFSFWLSHVPRTLVGFFWDLIRGVLEGGGRTFFVDNRFDRTWSRPDPYSISLDDDVQMRRVDDGTTHRVVKVFYEPDELAHDLEARGWEAWVRGTRWLIYGSATIPVDHKPGPEGSPTP